MPLYLLMWRRTFLKLALFASFSSAQARLLLSNFSPKNMIDTDKIDIKLPKVAEKNTSVPITVSSDLDNIQTIRILVANNSLVAEFNLSPQMATFVTARFTLKNDTNILVLAETPTVIYRNSATIKVSLNGCN